MKHNIFIHLSTDGYLGCFHSLAYNGKIPTFSNFYKLTRYRGRPLPVSPARDSGDKRCSFKGKDQEFYSGHLKFDMHITCPSGNVKKAINDESGQKYT